MMSNTNSNIVETNVQYTPNEIANMAVYNNLFVYSVLLSILYNVLFFYLQAKDVCFFWLMLVLFLGLLIGIPQLIVFVLLRHSLKENIVLSILGGLLLFLPVANLVLLAITLSRSSKRFRAASLRHGFINMVPKSEIRRLINEYGLNSPKRIIRTARIYSIVAAVLFMSVLAGTYAIQDKLYLECSGIYLELGQPEKHVRYLTESAERGNATAQCMLGNLYYSRFVSRTGNPDENAENMVKWWRKSAENGFAEAQFRLGTCLDDGLGIKKDKAEAKQWYLKALEQYKAAADRGDPAAQAEIGSFYLNGLGVEKDYAEALKWFRKAADQGQTGAQYYIGLCYMNGWGVKQDPSEGVKWWQMAAEQGDADAQCDLGVCYWYGNGVKRDYKTALKWLTEAAVQQNPKAIDILEEINSGRRRLGE